MRINKQSGILLLVVMTACIAAIIIAAVWFFAANQDTFADQKKHAEIKRIQASSKVYFHKLEFYDGACSDIVAGLDYKCNDTTASFASETILSNGNYYCTDSTGFIGETTSSIRGSASCPQE